MEQKSNSKEINPKNIKGLIIPSFDDINKSLVETPINQQYENFVFEQYRKQRGDSAVLATLPLIFYVTIVLLSIICGISSFHYIVTSVTIFDTPSITKFLIFLTAVLQGFLIVVLASKFSYKISKKLNNKLNNNLPLFKKWRDINWFKKELEDPNNMLLFINTFCITRVEETKEKVQEMIVYCFKGIKKYERYLKDIGTYYKAIDEVSYIKLKEKCNVLIQKIDDNRLKLKEVLPELNKIHDDLFLKISYIESKIVDICALERIQEIADEIDVELKNQIKLSNEINFAQTVLLPFQNRVIGLNLKDISENYQLALDHLQAYTSVKI